MSDILDKLAEQTQKTVATGYYETQTRRGKENLSLVRSLECCNGNPVITEIKTRSPSGGELVDNINIVNVAREMMHTGSVGISILTEPMYFNGELDNLQRVSEAVNIPLLMKDFIINPVQLSAAEKKGADIVLLIKTLFDREYSEISLDEMINQAHKKGLEVLLETHNLNEFNESMDTEADLIGINNRDLRTLNIDLETTKNIMETVEKQSKPVISESGIKGIHDIKYLKSCQVNGFLVGTMLMKSSNLGKTLRELIRA